MLEEGENYFCALRRTFQYFRRVPAEEMGSCSGFVTSRLGETNVEPRSCALKNSKVFVWVVWKGQPPAHILGNSTLEYSVRVWYLSYALGLGIPREDSYALSKLAHYRSHY
jgi:hypothetical protein